MLCLAVVALAGCAEQAMLRQAREQAGQQKWADAVTTLEEGRRRFPESPELRSQLLQVREQGLAHHLATAAAARDQGQLEEAMREVGAAQILARRDPRVEALLGDIQVLQRQDSAHARAEALLQRGEMGAAAEIIDRALLDHPRHAALLALQRHIQRERPPHQPMQAELAEQRAISLDFRDAPLRHVLDLVTRHSGVNFVIDRDVKADMQVTVRLHQARVDDALELLTSVHQLARKVIDTQTVLIYPNTTEKQREYQEQVVRVFHPVSGDAKGAAAFLRAMLRIREPFVDERSNLLAVRDTPENVRLAEKLVSLFDTPEPEVLLDVEVLEISSTRLTELGVKFPSSISLTPLPPGGAAGLTLGNIGAIGRDNVGLGVSGLLINLKREAGEVSTLANPRLRARNREKARILIGDKIPVITTTTGTAGFVAENVNYLEVGLKLDVEPTVYPDDEVAIRIALEVSSLGSAVKTDNGTLAYQIGTRNAATLLRLRDGETQLLAGLMNRDERSSASRLPGLGDIPLLGRLFGSQQDQGAKTELILSITPRILRNTRRPGNGEAEVWIGTESAPRLRRPTAGAPGWAPPRANAPVPNPAAGSDAPTSPVATAAGATATAAPVVPLATRLAPLWRAPDRVKVGETFEIEFHLPPNINAALRGVPVDLHYDTQRLRVIDVREGRALSADGEPTAFQHVVDPVTGRIQVVSMRKAATSAPSAGLLFAVRVEALAAGDATIRADGGRAAAIPGPGPEIPAASLTISVQ